MFIDEVKIFARAGHGGKGCVAFLRETFRPKGGPSGGNGGHGGNVILQADHDLNNLIAQYYQARLLAQNGENGLGKGMDGRAGKVCSARAVAVASAIATSPLPRGRRRASRNPAKRVRKPNFCWNCELSRTWAWSAIPTPANQRC